MAVYNFFFLEENENMSCKVIILHDIFFILTRKYQKNKIQ